MSEQRIGGTTGSAQIPNRTTHITGWGHEVPAATLTNADLEKIVETSDEWITTRTGIRERRASAREWSLRERTADGHLLRRCITGCRRNGEGGRHRCGGSADRPD